jgi:hypothetical protein
MVRVPNRLAGILAAAMGRGAGQRRPGLRPGAGGRRDPWRQMSSRMQIAIRQAPKMTHGASTITSLALMPVIRGRCP